MILDKNQFPLCVIRKATLAGKFGEFPRFCKLELACRAVKVKVKKFGEFPRFCKLELACRAVKVKVKVKKECWKRGNIPLLGKFASLS